MDSPTVSVIVTAYNAEKYLPEAIESILNQTYKDFELIIVNDGSKDKTLEVIKKYQAIDPRIIMDDHENLGICPSANRALRLAKGKYIIRMDADDIMTSNRIEEQVHYFETHPEVTMLSCDAQIINENGEVIGTQVMPGYESIEESERMRHTEALVICAHTGFAAHKKAFEDVGGYNENIRCVVDLDLFTRMIEKGHNLIIMRKFLVKYRIYSASVMGKGTKNFLLQNTDAYVKDSMKRRRKGEPELTFDEFIAYLDAQPFFTRLSRKRRYYSFYYHRAAMQSFGQKNYLKTLYLITLAFLLRPQTMGSKLLRQLKRRLLPG